MVKLTDVTGVGSVTAKLLSEHKIKTVEALASISLVELQKIPGFGGDLRARAIKKAAADRLQSGAVKQLTIPADHPQTAVKKMISQETAEKPMVVSLVANQTEADQGKKKNKKDGKKEEKIKDKADKRKGKNKNKDKDKDKDKDKKKGGKKKSKKKS